MRRHPLDGHLMRRPNIDDDDNHETITGRDGKPCRILKNGGTYRAGQWMRDSLSPLQRTLADASMQLHDGLGNVPGNRPGWAMGDAQQRIRDEAYVESVRELENAWRPQPGAKPAAGKPASDAAPPHDPPQPISFADAQKIRDEAYRQSVIDLENAWRTP